MRRRCYDTKNPQYKDYGGRGIIVCDRWKYNYDAFVADMGLKPRSLTLDRIDNEAGYDPFNCRWATRLEQNRNSRHVRYLEYGGERLRLTEWAERLHITPATLHERLTKGYADEVTFHVGHLA